MGESFAKPLLPLAEAPPPVMALPLKRIALPAQQWEPRSRLRRITQYSLLLAAVVSSWNALNIGGVQWVDIVLAVAFLLALLSWPFGRTPWIPKWVAIGAAGIVAVMIIQTAFPTDPLYMSSRFVIV